VDIDRQGQSLFLKKPFLFMKKLYRPLKGRMLGGVCAGIGLHFDIDPTVIRLVWAAFTFLSLGTGIVVYLIAWVLIPEGPDGETP
jgi:phage shock protein PspC (stress-responsive transcriptional regulator)